jgi:hypothetical protein
VFAKANVGLYLLVVIFGIDLEVAHARGAKDFRAPLGSDQELEPVQWKGTLRAGKD